VDRGQLTNRAHAHSKRMQTSAAGKGNEVGKRSRVTLARSAGTPGSSRAAKANKKSSPKGTGPKGKKASTPAALEGLRGLQTGKARKPDQSTKGGSRSASAGSAKTPSLPLSSRAAAQEASLARRRRIPLALAVLIAIVLLATSFPLSTIFTQHHQVSAAAAQLSQLDRENQKLAEQRSQLNSNIAIQRLAREDYQLVSPGQTLYSVLPASGHVTSASAGQPTSGDPGYQPLVDPADAPDMSPDASLAQQQAAEAAAAAAAKATASPTKSDGASGGADRAAPPSGFFSRVANSLEFWK
jgi:cell division protein FtsB